MDSREKTPSNLQGLLRFAIRTRGEDLSASPGNTYREMDKDKREFLESTLKAMTVDVIEEFHKAISVLEDGNSLPDAKNNSLNVIREYIENIDFANSFVKVGGTDIIFKCLTNLDDVNIQSNAAYVIAEMSQNNPFCQKHFVEKGAIPILITNFNKDENLACSSLHAVSSMIRSFPLGMIDFLKNGGIKSLKNCLSTRHSRVFVKACFMIACLSMENSDVRDEFVKTSVVPTLLEQLEPINEFDIKTETLLFALSELSKSPGAKNAFKLKDTYEKILKKIVEENATLPQCEEMVSYARLALENLQ